MALQWQLHSLLGLLVILSVSFCSPAPPSSRPSVTYICFPNFCTSDWFLTQIREDRRTTILNRALFYTRNASEEAKRLSCDPNRFYVSIWQIWPQWMYNATDPRLSWVYQYEENRNAYYQQMSIAFARLARGAATSLHLAEDFDNPPMNGIFGQQELVTLSQSTDITKLWKIMVNATRVSVLDLPLKPDDMGIQQRMWETEHILGKARRDGEGNVRVGNETEEGAGDVPCAFSTDPEHPLNALL